MDQNSSSPPLQLSPQNLDVSLSKLRVSNESLESLTNPLSNSQHEHPAPLFNPISFYSSCQRGVQSHQPRKITIQGVHSQRAHPIPSGTYRLVHIYSLFLHVAVVPSIKSIENSGHKILKTMEVCMQEILYVEVDTLLLNPKRILRNLQICAMKVLSPLQMSKHVPLLENKTENESVL